MSRGSDWVKAIGQVRAQFTLSCLTQEDDADMSRLQVEVLICTPSILSKFHPEDFPNLQTVATAGEPISVQ